MQDPLAEISLISVEPEVMRRNNPLSFSISQSNFDRLIAVFATLLTVTVLATLKYDLHRSNSDLVMYLLPWYQHIVQFGRWASLEGSFANYSPPYLYLLSLFSLLNGLLPPVVIIKLVPAPFMLFSAALFWSICRALGCSKRRSLLAGWIALVAPEVIVNTLVWGQCDIIHTTFILLFLRLMLARRPGWAMVSVGVALSFKLQVIFAGPALLALVLAGELPLWSVCGLPLVYAIAMVPAALSGRPWRDLLLVYANQTGYYNDLALHVANPYQLLLRWTNYPSKSITDSLTSGGLIIAALIILALIIFLMRCAPLTPGIKQILSVGLSLLVVPFVLPRMHDRYFFAGNMLILLLSFSMPRIAIPAILLQIAATMAYYPFLFGKNFGALYFLCPVAMVAFSILMLVMEMARLSPRRRVRKIVLSPAITGS